METYLTILNINKLDVLKGKKRKLELQLFCQIKGKGKKEKKKRESKVGGRERERDSGCPWLLKWGTLYLAGLEVIFAGNVFFSGWEMG